jgi:hypothetical protein
MRASIWTLVKMRLGAENVFKYDTTSLEMLSNTNVPLSMTTPDAQGDIVIGGVVRQIRSSSRHRP